jgi:hypothetical protein
LLPFVIPAGPQPDANITDLMDPTNRGMWPEGLSPGSNITDMHIWLKAREKPVYGLKAQVWRRVLETEHAIKRDMLIARELQRQLDERREGHDMQIAIPVPTVAAPTAIEREAHDATHYPFKAWCPFCVMGKATTAPHRRQAGADTRGSPMVMADFLHMKADGVFV